MKPAELRPAEDEDVHGSGYRFRPMWSQANRHAGYDASRIPRDPLMKAPARMTQGSDDTPASAKNRPLKGGTSLLRFTLPKQATCSSTTGP
jgi:hypothetical protein